jgi:hypothetical protein
VRLFDLAFNADQRATLAKHVARIDHCLRRGDLGGALVGLEGHWPAFLETYIDEAAIAAAMPRPPAPAGADRDLPAEPRQGMFDRLRSWWR